ncbi:MAG: leucine-rich repeat domain-containing protein [Cytophagales bacterium]|nr:leucine-rich repeat domain-containing protein [Cytophagales bacterium]
MSYIQIYIENQEIEVLESIHFKEEQKEYKDNLENAQFHSCQSLRDISALPPTIKRIEFHGIPHVNECLLSIGNQLPNLEFIYISMSNITELPWINLFPQLKRINIYSHELSKLPQEITHCQNLEVVNISECRKIKWAEVVPVLAQLPKLSRLDVDYIKTRKFPMEISQLQQIKSLHFGTQLKKRFSWDDYFALIQQMPNLRRFKATNINTDIPSSIKELKHLEKIQLNGNHGYYEMDFPLEVMELNSGVGVQHKDSEITQLLKKELSIEQKKLAYAFLYRGEYLEKLLPNPFPTKVTQEKWNVYLPHRISGFTIKELNTSFKEKNIKFSTKETNKTSHIVLSSKIKEEAFYDFLTKGYNFIIEDYIKEKSWEEETPYLMEEETQNEFEEQILSLIGASDEENCLLALSIMENGGVSSYFINHVLALKLFHPSPKVRKQADKLFHKYGSSSLRSFVGDASYRTRSVKLKDMVRFTDHEELDTGEFVSIFQNIIGKNPIHKHIQGTFSFAKLEIKTLPKCFKYWQNTIKYLDLSFNKEIDLVSVIGDLKEYHSGISEINLNSIQQIIPPTLTVFAELTSLEKIQAKNNILEDTSIFEKMTFLKELDLHNCQVKTWGKLPNSLQKLCVSKNKLSKIPEGILSCQGLLNLNLSQNKIKELPENFHQLSRLRILTLNNNLFTEFPDISKNRSDISELYVKSNQIERLEFDHDFVRLALIDLTNNNIKEVNWNVSIFSLRDLILDKNELTKIVLPNEGNLYKFSCKNNQLKEYPTNLTLHAPREVYLSNNKIESLPEDFSFNPSKIDLKNNLLSKIPNSFHKYQRRDWGEAYYFGGNPIKDKKAIESDAVYYF